MYRWYYSKCGKCGVVFGRTKQELTLLALAKKTFISGLIVGSVAVVGMLVAEVKNLLGIVL